MSLSAMNTPDTTGSQSTEKEITLFVKAGRKNDNLGACLESQRILLMVRVKRAAKKLPAFKTVLVSAGADDPVLSKLGLSNIPALSLDSVKSDVPDEIMSVLDKRYPGGLYIPEEEEMRIAEKVTRDILPTCEAFLKNNNNDASKLEAELQQLNEYLSKDKISGKKFLFEDTMSLLDCKMLPILHQMRVALERVKGYVIPEDYYKVYMYLFHGYLRKEFKKSCPTDMEIALYWAEKFGLCPTDIKMPEWLPESSHWDYFSFGIPRMAVCPPCPRGRTEEEEEDDD